MIRLLIFSVTVTLFFSCQREPTINYNAAVDTTAVVDDRIKDTTKILVSELPIKFDSTDIFLFAIGLVDLQERGGYTKISSDYYSNPNIAGSYRNNDKLTGNFFNIVFQNNTGQERKLTDQKLNIQSVTFLREIFNQTKKGYLLYSVYDRDSNRDKALSNSDLEALYISKIDGSGFRKVTRELHELFDWNSIRHATRIYFRTLEDKNKDGELTNKDKFHYYFIDFSGADYTITEYNPVKIFE